MRRRSLIDVICERHPELDARAAIEAGEVHVDGAVVTNPNSQVRVDARIVVKETKGLKGEAKLAAGLDALTTAVAIEGRVALDVGASTGGFTTELLRRGAKRVYAVDAGHGQLMGTLRQDARVVNLENLNAADVTRDHVPEPVEIVTIDVSYSPLRAIVPGVTEVLEFAPGAAMVALVKPMFELQAGELPTSAADLAEAVMVAEQAIHGSGWHLEATVESPLRGNAGAIEYFVLARLPG